MRPDNRFTTPDQRFFISHHLEAECHESFEMAGLPKVERLAEGTYSVSVVTDRDGEQQIEKSRSGSPFIESGSTIEAVAVLAPGNQDPSHLPHVDLERFSWGNPHAEVDAYEPGKGDLWLVRANLITANLASPLHNMTNEAGVMLWAPDKPLPYFDGSSSNADSRVIKYELVGAVTADMKLVVWPGLNGYHGAQYLLDVCIANANAKNQLELAVIDSEIHGSSLLNRLQLQEGLQAYLRYFDQMRGTSYTPTREPRDRADQFTSMTSDQFDRLQKVYDIQNRLMRGLIARD